MICPRVFREQRRTCFVEAVGSRRSSMRGYTLLHMLPFSPLSTAFQPSKDFLVLLLSLPSIFLRQRFFSHPLTHSRFKVSFPFICHSFPNPFLARHFASQSCPFSDFLYFLYSLTESILSIGQYTCKFVLGRVVNLFGTPQQLPIVTVFLRIRDPIFFLCEKRISKSVCGLPLSLLSYLQPASQPFQSWTLYSTK